MEGKKERREGRRKMGRRKGGRDKGVKLRREKKVSRIRKEDIERKEGEKGRRKGRMKRGGEGMVK